MGLARSTHRILGRFGDIALVLMVGVVRELRWRDLEGSSRRTSQCHQSKDLNLEVLHFIRRGAVA